MYRVFLGLGSNLGDRLEYLSRAVEEINTFAPIQSISSVYETEPVGMDTENRFYNLVVEVETGLQPARLLRRLRSIEKKLGRRGRTHMMDREIDIDILLYDGIAYEDAIVRVPHPQLDQRRFVLEPLREIAPLVVHPLRNQTIASLLRLCRDTAVVTRTDLRLHAPQSN
jgi:2-amino-4-hydroxy-6-hydroxymethyldihydropteridine diphosphokinase